MEGRTRPDRRKRRGELGIRRRLREVVEAHEHLALDSARDRERLLEALYKALEV